MIHQPRALLASLWNRERSEEPIDQRNEARARTPEELVQLFSGDIWRFVWSQLTRREDAEDAVMEVFAAAFSNFGQLQRAQSQRLWLLAVAQRKVADTIRKRYRRAEQPFTDLEGQPDAAHFSTDQIATRQALVALPEHERQALVLKYVSGLSTEEVAKVLRKSLPATNSLLQRARQNMRTALGPLGDLK